MPKVKGPLFSLSASGTFRNAMEFRSGALGTTVAGPRTRPSVRSPAQIERSLRFAQAVGGWHDLSPEQKAAWRTASAGTGLTGYQLYMSEYQTQLIQPPDQPLPPV